MASSKAMFKLLIWCNSDTISLQSWVSSAADKHGIFMILWTVVSRTLSQGNWRVTERRRKIVLKCEDEERALEAWCLSLEVGHISALEQSCYEQIQHLQWHTHIRHEDINSEKNAQIGLTHIRYSLLSPYYCTVTDDMGDEWLHLLAILASLSAEDGYSLTSVLHNHLH